MKEELKKTTIKMAEQSKVLNTPGAEKQTKRELFDALRQELETQVLEKASKSVWELILDNNGLGKEINHTVERVFCKLSGRELPLFPPPDANEKANDKEKEKDKGKGKGKGKGKETAASDAREKEKSNSASKKRSFSELNEQGEGEDHQVAAKSNEPPVVVPEEDSQVLKT